MNLAIIMASKTVIKAGHEREIPKVGAVIAVGDEVVAMASRGESDHAEKIALDEARRLGVDLSVATVYTTLEPCVAGVRRRTLDSCADRLVAASVQRVVVGIHDPNKDVAGKGFLRLQEKKIATDLFPEKYAHRIRELNEEFIRGQQSLGIEIDKPLNGQPLETEPKGKVTLTGKWIHEPEPLESVRAIVTHGGYWWPQEELLKGIPSEKRWSVQIYIGSVGLHRVVIGKVNPLGKTLLQYYRRVIRENKKRYDEIIERYKIKDFPKEWKPWIGIEMEGTNPPKGIDIEDEVEFNVTKVTE